MTIETGAALKYLDLPIPKDWTETQIKSFGSTFLLEKYGVSMWTDPLGHPALWRIPDNYQDVTGGQRGDG